MWKLSLVVPGLLKEIQSPLDKAFRLPCFDEIVAKQDGGGGEVGLV